MKENDNDGISHAEADREDDEEEEVEEEKGFFKKIKIQKFEMTGDGFPKWDPSSSSYKNVVIASFLATCLAVVGADLIALSFPEDSAHM